jgi:NAD-dependent dihydropyrimidine dehydrogenase PreA subunit
MNPFAGKAFRKEQNRMDFSTLQKNLEALGYEVHAFEDSRQANAHLAEELKGKTVGIGGSTTAAQMGLYDALSKESKVVTHSVPQEGKTADELKAEAAQAEVYISSVNGIAETGEIINIDHSGNRVASTIYGHKKVILLVGENKVALDYEAAYHRARNIAGPKNAQRLGRKTPCAIKADKCYDCKSPERICRAVSVFLTKPASCAYEIVLIHEDLGY